METLKILVWPIVVILIVVFIVLLLKNSLKDLLTRITKLKYGETVAEVQTRQETNEKSLLVQNQTDKSNENIEKALGIFSVSTIERAKNIVESESKINEILDGNKKVETLIKYSEALYLILSFERLYNNIFGSQLYILEFVNTNNTQTKNDLKIYYDMAKEKYPDFFKSYPYDEYFNYLIKHELLILKENNTCGITWLGRDFLKYLIETGKPTGKRY